MDEKEELIRIAKDLSKLVQRLSKELDAPKEEKKITLITIPEAAALIDGISVYQIRLLIKNGKLPYIRAGSKMFINKDILIRYFNNEEI